MKVRIFLPADETLEPFAFGEFEFDVMPTEGQILRFEDLEDADYPVERSGFIQEDQNYFVGAVWLGPPRRRNEQVEILIADTADEPVSARSNPPATLPEGS